MFSKYHVSFRRTYDDVSDWRWIFRSSHHRCSVKKVLLKILRNSQENICARVSFLIKLQVSGCEFCKNWKNTFFTKHIWTATSEFCTEFLRKYTKNEILRNTAVQISSSMSWFNDFEVFLLYLETVLYFSIDLYLELFLLLISRFIFGNRFTVGQ